VTDNQKWLKHCSVPLHKVVSFGLRMTRLNDLAGKIAENRAKEKKEAPAIWAYKLRQIQREMFSKEMKKANIAYRSIPITLNVDAM
jgi:hypothetical protein